MMINMNLPDKGGMMYIVFNISDEEIKNLKTTTLGTKWYQYLIKQGKLLPEHGKIVDISKIDKDRIESDNPVISITVNGECIEAVSLDYLNSLPPIIETKK